MISQLLTEFRVWCSPHLCDNETSLGTHEADVVLAILVGVEPVKLVTLVESLVEALEANVLVGTEKEAVAGGGRSFESSKELPVFLAEPLFANELVGLFKSIEEELAVQVIAGVVSIPELLLVLGGEVTIHADEEVVLRTKHLRPAAEMCQCLIPGIVAENGSQGKKEARRLDALDVAHAILESSPKATTGDDRVGSRVSGDEVVDIVLKRCLGDVEGHVGGLLFGLLESSQEVVNLSGVSVMSDGLACKRSFVGGSW